MDYWQLRDRIRAATVGAPKRFKSETFTIEHPDGGEVEVEVRQPSLGLRTEITELSAKERESDTPGKDRFGLIAMRRMCYVPGTDVLVFEDADLDSLVGQPTGGWIDDLMLLCMKLMNVVHEKDRAEKNSEATQGD